MKPRNDAISDDDSGVGQFKIASAWRSSIDMPFADNVRPTEESLEQKKWHLDNHTFMLYSFSLSNVSIRCGE